LQGEDPDPVLPENSPRTVFIMDLRGKPAAAAPKEWPPPTLTA
jgi:hypothetical protein